VVAQAFIAHLEGQVDRDEAERESARCDARWRLRRQQVPIKLSELSEVELGGLMVYSRTQADLHAFRGTLRDPSRGAVRAPAKEEIKRAEAFRPNFLRWYRPIEGHQVSTERIMLALGRFGDETDAEAARELGTRGDAVNAQLEHALHSGALPWLPEHRHSAAPLDAWWVRQILGTVEATTHENITKWWRQFSLHRGRYVPAQRRDRWWED